MEFLKNIIHLFYYIFNYQNYEKEVISEKSISYSEFLLYFIQGNKILILIFIILFLILFYLIFFNSNKYNLISLVNISIFFIILLLFPLNIPFTDAYNELSVLFSKTSSIYLVSGDHSGGFFFVLFRIIHLIIYKFFDLNYNIIIYLNFIIFTLSIFLVIFYLKKYELQNYIFLFILFIFNGKWFVHFYEPVNIVWTINFILIITFLYLQKIENNLKRNLSLSIVLILSILNFKAGIVIFAYSIIYGLLIKDKYNNKIFYILAPIIIYFFAHNFVQSFTAISDHNTLDLLKNSLSEKSYNNIFVNFFASQALAITPQIFPIKNLTLVFVVSQYLYMLNILLFKNQRNFNSIKTFILNNPLILIGFLGCLLINLSREDYNQSRYMSFSLLFQIGFFILFLKNISTNFRETLTKKKILVTFFLLIYLLNFFLPNQGIIFSLKKNYVFENVKSCFKNYNYHEICFKKMFYQTFYDINQEKFDQFKGIIYKIKKENLSLFNQIKN